MTETFAGVGCLDRIRNNMQSFSGVGTRIAEFILKNAEQCIHMTVIQFAEACATSEASVVRFCKNLGYSGFHDLKIYLASELSLQGEPMLSELQTGDDELVILQKVFASEIHAMQKTMEIIDVAAFKAAVDAILYSRKVEFYAYGNSRPIVHDAQYRLLKIGINAYCGIDMGDSLIHANMLVPGDVAIGVSFSGSTRQVCSAMEAAKRRGATTICITGFPRSPITQYSDHCLYAYVNNNWDSQTTTAASRAAEVAILDALYAAVAMKRFDKSMEFIKLTDKILTDEKI